MQGISTLFMVLANHPDMTTWGKNVIDTAKKPPRPSKMSPAMMLSHLNNLFMTTRERGFKSNWKVTL
jgi:hypothetical protein